jgi:hypothetical protein
MPLIFRLIGSVAFLSVAVFSADAALRDQSGSLHWQTFQVPEYGTRVDYPARIFASVGGAEKALVNVSKAMMVGPPSLVMHARTRRATHRPVISGRTYGSLASITNESLVLSLRSPWNGRARSNYSRCNFSRSARGAIHCFDLVYPQDEKREWDPVVTRISLSLRPLER